MLYRPFCVTFLLDRLYRWDLSHPLMSNKNKWWRKELYFSDQSTKYIVQIDNITVILKAYQRRRSLYIWDLTYIESSQPFLQYLQLILATLCKQYKHKSFFGRKRNEINPFTYGNLKPVKLLIILHKTISNIRGNQGIT